MADVIAGRFELADPIGRGGSGVVWRAFDRKTRRECAAKVLRRRDAGDLLRFVREQSVRVEGEHVLAPYAWAAEDEHVVIASELVRGGAVSGLVGDYGPLAEATVTTLLRQLLTALGHVHAAGLVHRDVKTANVLLEASGKGPIDSKLSDFGLAITTGDPRLTAFGTVIGTPGYLAPELLDGVPEPHPRHDLYAAGQVAGALLRGVEPTDSEPVDVSTLDDRVLADTVRALTTTDPQERPGSAAAALDLLAAAEADPIPHTADGDVVEIFDHLAELIDNSEPDEAATRYTEQILHPHVAPGGTAPEPAVDAPATVPLPNASAVSLPAEPIADHGAAGVGVTPKPTARRRDRTPATGRRWLLGAVGVLVVFAVGALALNAWRGGDSQRPPSSPPSVPGSTSGQGSAPPTAVAVGGVCSWQQEGNLATAGDGTAVVCTRRGQGYEWVAR